MAPKICGSLKQSVSDFRLELKRHAPRIVGGGHGRDRAPLAVAYGHRNTEHVGLTFAIVNGEAAFAHLLQLGAQFRAVGDGVGCQGHQVAGHG